MAAARPLLVVASSAELYGADRSLLAELPTLARHFSVTLVVPGPGPLVERARAFGATVLELPDYALRARFLRVRGLLPWATRVVRATLVLVRLHRRIGFALVYSTTLAAVVGALVGAVTRVPHVQHVREYPYHGRARRKLLLGFTRLTSDRLICNSRYTQQATIEAAPALADRSVVVHNGTELPAEVRPARLEAGVTRVVCAARINRWKGQEQLVEAARIARSAGSRWELHLFGDTLPEHRDVEDALRAQVAAAGLEEVVRFHGFAADRDEVYRSADVVVVPSVIPEPFGLTVIEAQARGLPVVATGPGGPDEIIVDGVTGIIVPHRDPRSLAAAIRRLEDPVLRSSMGRYGRERVLEHFTEQASAEGVLAVLESTVPSLESVVPAGRPAAGITTLGTSTSLRTPRRAAPTFGLRIRHPRRARRPGPRATT